MSIEKLVLLDVVWLKVAVSQNLQMTVKTYYKHMCVCACPCMCVCVIFLIPGADQELVKEEL